MGSARRKPAPSATPSPAPDTPPPPASSPRPLVFISHDTRDADLAEALANLLDDASAGMLKSFRSSDKKTDTGIGFGQEWYAAIMQKLDAATDAIAILTPHSLNRPWILYETGVAKGKLDTPVIGLAIGVDFSEVQRGPFAQFQNSADDEESLAKLVRELLAKHLNSVPRPEAIRRHVQAFREQVAEHLKKRVTAPEPTKSEDDANTAAKLFEEIKVLVRDVPSLLPRLQSIESALAVRPGLTVGDRGQPTVPPARYRPHWPFNAHGKDCVFTLGSPLRERVDKGDVSHTKIHHLFEMAIDQIRRDKRLLLLGPHELEIEGTEIRFSVEGGGNLLWLQDYSDPSY